MSDLSGKSDKRKVLLIGWDAADWEVINPLLEEGLMPSLEGLIDRGVMGNLATLQPILSPMLWNSVATGKYADKHGIHGFIEPDSKNGGARPYSSTSRKCKALWNILTQSGLRSNVVGWWASHPAEPVLGNVVTNGFSGVKMDPERGWMVPPGTVHPADKAGFLARFKVFPSELTEAHVLPFIPDAAKIDQQIDNNLSMFAKVLSDAATIHAVATALMEIDPADFTAVYYDAVDHFSHAFMVYHPPRLPWVGEQQFEMYKDVVRGAYRFHDMMLERLLQLAGPDTTVILCSDHGFESGSQRPHGMPREPAGPAIWHRQYGILVMAGPGIKKDERIYGASLIDIAPTILTLFGLPIGEDMDGRPLLEAFEAPPGVETIPSWESRAGDAGMHPAGFEMDPGQAQELMQQFAALGYIDDPSVDKEQQAESAEIEAKYNISRTHMWKNEPDRAQPLIEEIVRRRPWEDRFLHQLATCYFQAGYFRQAERVLRAIYDNGEPDHVSGFLMLARIEMALGNLKEAYRNLERAEEMKPAQPAIYTQIGRLYEQLMQLDKARGAYEKAVAIDPDNALAYQGLSNVYRRQGLNQETVDAALHAVSLLHRLPLAHFNLGVAMARGGQPERAIVAFETALRFGPTMHNAHRYLATLHRSRNGGSGDLEKAKFHHAEAARLLRIRPASKTKTDDRSETVFDLPEIPKRKERFETLLKERPDPKPPEKRSGKTFILVSGLPRSGTSLMMQMLEAGGVKILTDRERAADIDNPKGYYEWEPIKQIGKKPELLDQDGLDGCAIKCISMLLQQMPIKHNYKVIFMTRPIEEVVASQRKMIERMGTQGANLDLEQLERGLVAHRQEISSWLRNVPHMEFIEIDYPTLIRDPDAIVTRITEFLGQERLPSHEKMKSVVDPSLYRKKSSA
jgi:predicted AlkP superfamily phosphohydrolase/phosphomutase/tetratricopeptide (TPR) repeat protein